MPTRNRYEELKPLLNWNQDLREDEQIHLQETALEFIVPAGYGAAYAFDSNGHVAGFKFGRPPFPQRLLELLVSFPYLERLVFYCQGSAELIELPPSLGGLDSLRFASISGNIRSFPEEILRLGIPIVAESSERPPLHGDTLPNGLDAVRLLAGQFERSKDPVAGEGKDPELRYETELHFYQSLSRSQRDALRESTAHSVGFFVQSSILEDPPIEILARGNEAIASYFRERGVASLKLNEVKVLLVGNGGCGKTSLVKQIVGEKFDPVESQTHGINIRTHALESEESGRITANFWDFGGQEVMHATHQFFLSKRSLYILVLDGRKEEDPEYWLQHIQSFGGDSPIIIVLNKIDEHPAFDLNRRFLTGKYPGITGFFKVSCATGYGIKNLKDTMHRQLDSATILQTKWPRVWFRVKERLEHLESNYISMAEYNSICEDEGVSDYSSRDALIDFLNDLGVVLHFRDLQLLDTHVLDPRWVTEGVYRIINSEILAKQRGVLRVSQLKDVFKASKINGGFEYPPEKYNYIVELMLKFELCYRLENDSILVPDLLDIQEPELNLDLNSALRFVFEYQYLPKSIMPRFIVRLHKDIREISPWRTGVILEDNALKTTAVVRADEKAKRIYVNVTGNQKRDYFAILRKTISDINGSFEKLSVTERVPLPGFPEELIEYRELIGHELAGKREMFVGRVAQEFSVPQLLNGIEDETARRQYAVQTVINVQGTYINAGSRSAVTTIENKSVLGGESMQYQPQTWEKAASYGAALLLVVSVLFLLIRNQPIADPNLVVALRILLSLMVAVLGASIPGMLGVDLKTGKGIAIRASGALALFVISFFMTPKVLGLH